MKIIKKLRFSLLALIMVATAAVAAIINLAGTPEAGDEMGANVAAGDFNCDGNPDLVVGLPGQDNILGASNAGAINVIYSTGSQLGATGNVQLALDAFTTAAADDRFGQKLAAGDFDGDGCDDLAAGMPARDVGGISNAGQVIILYGHSSGLGSGGPDIWDQNSPGVNGGAELNDYFGVSLAAGDYNGDGFDDLAIGIQGENNSAGYVFVMHGQTVGLATDITGFFSQNSAGIASSEESFDNFGSALASGDFNNDGYDDLAIGVPTEDQDDVVDAGGVHVLHGSASSLSGSGSQWWNQDTAGVLGVNGESDMFGLELAAGDFNNDGHDDLAIGVPREGWDTFSSPTHCGAVNVLYGSSASLSATGDQLWEADVAPIMVECGSLFGNALTAADFNGDGRDDLAIGAPSWYLGFTTLPGSLQLLYGAAAGLTGTGTQYIHQNVANVEGVAEAEDWFAADLAAGDFNNDGRADLAVGVPRENTAGIRAGAAQVFYGATGALTPFNDQLFRQ